MQPQPVGNLARRSRCLED